MNASVTSVDLRVVNTVLGMGGGYVLDFSDRTFEEFFAELGVNIEEERYHVDGRSKAKRLRCFLKQTPAPLSGRVLAALLDYRVVAEGAPTVSADLLARYSQIVQRLGGASRPERAQAAAPVVQSEAELLARVFRPEALARLPLDAGLQAVLRSRMNEAQRCIQHDACLAAVILCGSVLEGLCLGVGSYDPQRVNRAFTAQYSQTAPRLHEWKLRQWIEVLERLGDLTPNISKFGHALRDFRNYVHPRQQLATNFSPDLHTARISFHVVAAAIDDLAAAHGARA